VAPVNTLPSTAVGVHKEAEGPEQALQGGWTPIVGRAIARKGQTKRDSSSSLDPRVLLPSFITFRSCAYLDKKHTIFGR
jgi:hypothetical protein